jgi:hypothetical protein
MRQLILVLALLLISTAAAAQSVSHITVTDTGNTFVLAGNFANDGGGDIVGEDANGNLNCLPSDGGKYDQGTVVSDVQFDTFVTNIGAAAATLKPGQTDYIILGSIGIVNVYSSSACTFTLTQSLIVPGIATDVFLSAPIGGTGGDSITVVSSGETAFTFYSQIYQNNDGTLAPGPAGLGPGEAGYPAGTSIGIANFVEPQPPGPFSTLNMSLWSYQAGAWTSTPTFVVTGIPLGFVVAPNTKALYLVSYDETNIYVQQVDQNTGAPGSTVKFPVGDQAYGIAVFDGDSFAIPFTDSVQIFQDVSGNGIWAPLGTAITVPAPASPPLLVRNWTGSSSMLASGFALQSPDGTATAFTVTSGATLSALASLAFPGTAPGTTSTLPLTVTNSGDAVLIVTGATFSGPNAADFSQTNDCASVAPLTTCSVSIVFTPSTLLAESATLTIASNAVNSPNAVALTSGVAPAPIVVTSSTSLDYGSVAVNTSATKTLNVGNSGTAAANNLAVQVSGAGFTVSNSCPSSLAVLAQCSVTVTFSPTATGAQTGTLTVTSNISPVTVALLGTGTPAAAVTATPPALSGSSGGTLTAQISFANFPSSPTVTAACQIPAGTCTIQNNSQLVVTTTARSSAGLPVRRFPGLYLPLAILIGVMVWSFSRRRRTVLAFAAAVLLAGCGGGQSTPPPVLGTPAGTYNVIVTGTAGSVSQSVTVPVTVD